MKITVDVLAPVDITVPEYVEFARRAEGQGFDGIAIADHLDQGRDAFVALGLCAAATSRITLYPGVSNPLTRHPFVLAALTRSINEVAPGRFDLMLGAGDNSAAHTGQPASTIDQMRNAVTSIRALLRGEQVTFGASQEQLDQATYPLPKVGIAASGPRMTELAGECADAALLLVGVDGRIIDASRSRIAAGAHRRNRSVDSIAVRWGVLISVDDDLDAARERTRGYLFQWVNQGLYDEGMRAIGMEPVRFEHPGDCSGDLLTRLTDALFIVGPPSACADRMREMADAASVDHLFCMIAGSPSESVRSIEQLSATVLPNLQS